MKNVVHRAGQQPEVPLDRAVVGVEPVAAADVKFIAPVGATFSMRKGMSTLRAFTARSTSLRTGPESFAAREKTMTMILQCWMPRRIESPHSSPGRMLSGAIQHEMPFDVRNFQTALAISWSEVE